MIRSRSGIHETGWSRTGRRVVSTHQARGSLFKALSYLHRQVYPMAEFKRSNLDNLMTSDPTDGIMSYIYAHARPHSQKPIFNT